MVIVKQHRKMKPRIELDLVFGIEIFSHGSRLGLATKGKLVVGL